MGGTVFRTPLTGWRVTKLNGAFGYLIFLSNVTVLGIANYPTRAQALKTCAHLRGNAQLATRQIPC